MKRVYGALAVLGLLLAGCSEAPSGPRDIPFEHVEGCSVEQADARSGSLRTLAEWEAFWADHCAGTLPDVDFGRQVVVFDAWGRRPTGGHSTELVEVRADKEAMEVTFLRTQPGATCPVTDALTYPTAVAVVDARRDATVLSHGIETEDC